MTGLHEFSRKSFLRGGGALVVGVGSASAASNAAAATGNTPFNQRGPQDYLPNLQAIDSWLAITPDNKVIVTHGEPEFAGTPTGILMIVAEELNTTMDQMIYARPESWLNSTGGGGGSGGISTRSTQIRAAAAYAKQQLLGMASTSLGVPVAGLAVSGGVVSGGGKSVTYGQLIGGKNFNYTMTVPDPGSTSQTATMFRPGDGISKPVSQYALVGRQVRRIDIPAKVMGTYTYVHNVRVPGMVHARSVRPRGAGANTSQNHFPLSVDASSISHIPGAQVVQIGNWLAVWAPKEYDAIQAAAQLKVVWKSDPKFGDGGSGDFWAWLRKAGDTNTVNPPRYTADTGGVPTAMASAAKSVSATYRYHYNNFVPIGPHCAVASVNGTTSATVFIQGQTLTGTGGDEGGPVELSSLLGIPPANIRVIWREGSGSYGGGQEAEAAEQAALISQRIGKPVRLQWMRWDQTGWDCYGPAHMYDVTMGADPSGRIVASDWVSYGQASSMIDTTRELLGTATWPAVPAAGGPTPSDGGSTATPYANTNYGSSYRYQRRVLAKTQPLYGGALKSSALRSPNAPQSYFASEQIVDELAHASSMDPVAFRRLNIDGTSTIGARWLAVIDAVTIAAGWKPRVANSAPQTGTVRKGRGFGLGTFANSQVALVVDAEVNVKSGKLTAKHVWIAQNNGITVNLEGVGNQMSGALIMGLSRVMWEAPSWNKERVTSIDWVTYPILRFRETPAVTLINVHPGEYSVITPGSETGSVQKGNTEAWNEGWLATGSGEPPGTAIGSAMANAFFDATGARIREAPMRPAVVRGALKAAGIA
jgi:CO/xanthine dehydrogenase Mo-binding subunit